MRKITEILTILILMVLFFSFQEYNYSKKSTNTKQLIELKNNFLSNDKVDSARSVLEQLIKNYQKDKNWKELVNCYNELYLMAMDEKVEKDYLKKSLNISNRYLSEKI